MLKSIGLAGVLLAAGALPAFAEDACQAPPIPAAIDGAAATKDQIVADIKKVNDYQASVEAYKGCISDYVAAQNAQADRDKKPHDTAMIQAEGDKINAAD